MCGIIGIIGNSAVNQSIYDGLSVLQHRGQDAAGITTIDSEERFHTRKANGLVDDVFKQKHMLRLQGNIGIGHVRYPTAGSSSVLEAQPFLVNAPYGIALAHNGNLTNVDELKKTLLVQARRHVNTNSDSEVLLNIFAHYIDSRGFPNLTANDIFKATSNTLRDIRGAYACVALILGYGLVAFRDPNGIRPLVFGQRTAENGKIEYMFASESVALDVAGFDFVRDVRPGEVIYIENDGNFHSNLADSEHRFTPCIFEYVYFSRPDSYINGVSVYAARVHMGEYLGQAIAKQPWADEIDVVIPIPDTSNDIALRISNELDKPYRQGFVKNRYVGRTFIMPGQEARRNSVRRKLNAIGSEFKDKNVLLVDDSIVRGTTSEQIVEMARAVGAKKVFFASAAPEIYYPNVYGIDMPTSKELLAYGRTNDEIAKEIGVDEIIFQRLEDLKSSITDENPNLVDFECSVFTGDYVTGDINNEYLDNISLQRNDKAKSLKIDNQ